MLRYKPEADGDTAKTIAPLSEAVARASQHDNIEPEFCDSAGAKLRYGLGRSYLYQLHAQGLIEGCSLRERGKLKGKRLWNVASIRRYLYRKMEERE